VVSGDHTASGYPIMANDPHLGLEIPPIMINENIVIRDEGRVVSGVGIPGTPLTLLGCNLNLCWGLTNHNVDVTDWYQEELLVNAYGLPTHTLYQGEAEPLIYGFQSYFVNNIGNGEMDSITRANVGYDAGGITFIVPRRNNGPIVAQPEAGAGISVQYAGWGATFELSTLRGFERASNMDRVPGSHSQLDLRFAERGLCRCRGQYRLLHHWWRAPACRPAGSARRRRCTAFPAARWQRGTRPRVAAGQRALAARFPLCHPAARGDAACHQSPPGATSPMPTTTRSG
jgi:hypothetical protein